MPRFREGDMVVLARPYSGTDRVGIPLRHFGKIFTISCVGADDSYSITLGGSRESFFVYEGMLDHHKTTLVVALVREYIQRELCETSAPR